MSNPYQTSRHALTINHRFRHPFNQRSISLQYYMQYTSQPFIYRESPNPAFHEAVAHAIGLNVGGPVHLQKIGLLSSPISTSSGNSMINIEYLLNVALDKLPFMAFSLSVEKVKSEQISLRMQIASIHQNEIRWPIFHFTVAMVRVRERPDGHECALVGSPTSLSRPHSTARSIKQSFRRWR